jgi:hypothetical protein
MHKGMECSGGRASGETLHVCGMALRARQEPRPSGRPLVNQPILYLSHLLHIELPPDQSKFGKNR